jgi:hypothetical protein
MKSLLWHVNAIECKWCTYLSTIWNSSHFSYETRKFAHFQNWIYINIGQHTIDDILGQWPTYLNNH